MVISTWPVEPGTILPSAIYSESVLNSGVTTPDKSEFSIMFWLLTRISHRPNVTVDFAVNDVTYLA